MTQTQLIRISAAGDSLALHGYADTLVYLPVSSASEKPTLIAVRLGGDPAVTQALTFALSGGCEFKAELNGDSLVLNGKKMRYKRKISTAAPYAQALLTAEDEEVQGKEKAQGREGIKTYVATRVCYLYCPPGDHTHLFRELQKKTSVPMLPEFEDYVLDECRCRGILTPLTVLSTTEKFEAWRLMLARDDKNLVDVVNDGLKSGALHIPGAASGQADVFENVSTISQYLNTFGAQIAEKIKSRFEPLYDPTMEPPSTEVQRIDANIYRHTGYHLYDAQMAVAESVKRRIDQGRPAIIVAECGSGKTKIGAAALAASQREEGGKKFNIVLCPSHVAEKWVRELNETVPNVRAAVVRTIRELKTVYADYQRKSTNVYAVISKESARDGYVRYPAVNIGHAGRQTVFRCPDCGEIVEQPLNDGGVTYWVTADASFFLRENAQNHKCRSCGSPLWAPLTDGAAPKSWAKIGGFGYVYRKELQRYYDLTNNPAILEKLDELSRQSSGSASTVPRAPRRYPLSTYIRKKMSGKIDGLIADELHRAPIRACA